VGPLRNGTGEPRELWKFDMAKAFGFTPDMMWSPGHDTDGSPVAHGEPRFVPTGHGLNRSWNHACAGRVGETESAPAELSSPAKRRNRPDSTDTVRKPGSVVLGVSVDRNC